MLWLIGIASIWTFCCSLAVALCVMARRGDDAMAAAMARLATREPEPEVAFVTTFAEPAPATAARAAVQQRSAV
jgi:DNA-binding LytR/AlgR family response regulator